MDLLCLPISRLGQAGAGCHPSAPVVGVRTSHGPRAGRDHRRPWGAFVTHEVAERRAASRRSTSSRAVPHCWFALDASVWAITTHAAASDDDHSCEPRRTTRSLSPGERSSLSSDGWHCRGCPMRERARPMLRRSLSREGRSQRPYCRPRGPGGRSIVRQSEGAGVLLVPVVA
jgi:hypothetical protein